jgi:transposase
MTYSVDLRKRVVAYVKKGGKKTEGSRVFGVSRGTVSEWCSRTDLKPKKVKRRKRKLDWEALARDVEEYPSALLRERAARFGVHVNAIWYALQQMKIHYKKNIPIPRKKT